MKQDSIGKVYHKKHWHHFRKKQLQVLRYKNIGSHLWSVEIQSEIIDYLIDNAPTHPSEELKSDDRNITCLFLPANITPLLRTMDQVELRILSVGTEKV